MDISQVRNVVQIKDMITKYSINVSNSNFFQTRSIHLISDYELPPQYMNDPVLVRGCFVLKVPDRCYTAKNGLSYCWCSTKDLCNSASSLKMNLLSSYGQTLIQSVLSRASFLYSPLWWWHNDVHSMKKEDDTTILVDYDCYQLFLSAFFWFCYNNGVMHRLFLPTILHQNVL